MSTTCTIGWQNTNGNKITNFAIGIPMTTIVPNGYQSCHNLTNSTNDKPTMFTNGIKSKMARQLIWPLIIQQQNAYSTLLYGSIYQYHLKSTDAFLLNTDERRCPGSIPPIENYYELTIPRYSDDFKMHFRLTRETFEATCLRLSRHDAFNRQKGPAPYIEKELLMYLWHIGNFRVFQIYGWPIRHIKG